MLKELKEKLNDNTVHLKQLNKGIIVYKKGKPYLFGKKIPSLENEKEIINTLFHINKYIGNFIPQIHFVIKDFLFMEYIKGIDGRLLIFFPPIFKNIGTGLKKWHLLGRKKNNKDIYLHKIKNLNMPCLGKTDFSFLERDDVFISVLHNDFTLRNFIFSFRRVVLLDFEGLFHPNFPNPFFNIIDLGIFLINLLSFYELIPFFYKFLLKSCVSYFLKGYGVNKKYAMNAMKITACFHLHKVFIDRELLIIYKAKKNFIKKLSQFVQNEKGFIDKIFA